MNGPSSAVTIRGLDKSHGTTHVLRALDLDIPAGGVTAILGASGSGKTTLLRLLAGFDTGDAGIIRINGVTVDDGQRTVRPQRRGVGYVPQDSILFPHLTVAANIGFGVPRAHRRAQVEQLLEIVGLAGYQRRYPHQLSGGQQQRIAVARALAIRPQLILLDEPFGALDAMLRDTVRADVMAILARTGTTTVLVTHDQDEALSLSDHIALLDAGHITAHGSPRALYEHPIDPTVANAIGTANILPGQLGPGVARCALGDLPTAAPVVTGPAGPPTPPPAIPTQPDCLVLVRPEQLALSPDRTSNSTPARIIDTRYHGHDTLIRLAVDAGRTAPDLDHPAILIARVAGSPPLRHGQSAWVTFVGTAHVWTNPPRAHHSGCGALRPGNTDGTIPSVSEQGSVDEYLADC